MALPSTLLVGATAAAVGLGLLVRAARVTVPEGAVARLTVAGRETRTLDPGTHWVVPFVSATHRIDTTQQTVTLDCPAVGTADGATLALELAVDYTVVGPERAYRELAAPESTLADHVEVRLRRRVNRSPAAAVLDDPETVREAVAADVVAPGVGPDAGNSEDAESSGDHDGPAPPRERWGLRVDALRLERVERTDES
jgi:regulator of protease activity HflC (stomatin/prohibitin superfamily)